MTGYEEFNGGMSRKINVGDLGASRFEKYHLPLVKLIEYTTPLAHKGTPRFRGSHTGDPSG